MSFCFAHKFHKYQWSSVENYATYFQAKLCNNKWLTVVNRLYRKLTHIFLGFFTGTALTVIFITKQTQQ